MKPLTQKDILKRHKNTPQDKPLHNTIETKEIKKEDFNKLIKEGTKQKPFDKRLRHKSHD